MHYLRVFEGKFDDWFSGQSDCDALLFHCFGIDRQALDTDIVKVSVFECSTDVEEAEAAAAHRLTRHSSILAYCGARIFQADVSAWAIDVSQTDGTTGVKCADDRHRNLQGSKSAFRDLVRSLLEKVMSGEDRVRRIHKSQMRHQVERFAQFGGPPQIDGQALARCQKALS